MNPGTASVQAYIVEQRRYGHSDDAIYQSLLASGWPAATLHELLQGGSATIGLPVYQQSAVEYQPAVQSSDLTTGFLAAGSAGLDFY